MTDFLIPGLLVLGIAATNAAADDPPPIEVAVRRADDRADVKTEKDRVIVSVHSPFGISHAAIARTGEKWPDAVVLRLHLKGLEHFKLAASKVKLEGSATLREGKPMVRLWKDGKEDEPLDARSPFWMDVRILSADGKQAKEIPLKEGYFEMQLPKAMFDGNPKTITVDWIDFFRG
jgi:hypothetical protein